MTAFVPPTPVDLRTAPSDRGPHAAPVASPVAPRARARASSRGATLVESLVVLGLVGFASLGAVRAYGARVAESATAESGHVANFTGIKGGGGAEACGKECPGGPGQNCFVAGTLVATPSGVAPIEALRVGDVVVSRDERTGEVVARPVTETFVTLDAALVDVRLVEGDVVRATPGHLFWTADRSWATAGSLVAGEPLRGEDGRELHVAAVEPVAARATVYNVEVAGTHTYFVGDDGIWVHNPTGETGGCGGGGAPPAGSAEFPALGPSRPPPRPWGSYSGPAPTPNPAGKPPWGSFSGPASAPPPLQPALTMPIPLKPKPTWPTYPTSIWSSDGNGVQHYKKHAAEYPDLNAGGYMSLAKDITKGGPGISRKKAKDGTTYFWDSNSDSVVVVNASGSISSMFKPSAGKAYYDNQGN